MSGARVKPSEVVVIGGGVGGLSAAIYARLQGHSVCLLEGGAAVGGKAAEIRVGGYRLDPGPSIIILTRIYDQLFRDAGRGIESYLRFNRLDPISRVYFGSSSRLDLPSDRAACERLVDGISSADGRNFRKLMEKLDRVSPHIDKSVFAHPFDRKHQLLDRHLLATALPFDVRKPYKALVDEWFQSPLLRAFFYGFPSYGGQTYDSKAPGALLIPYLMIQEGVFYPEGGVGAIPKALLRLALDLGVEVRTGARVTKLLTRGEAVTAATLEDGTSVDGEVFISGVDRLTAQGWLGPLPDLPPSFSYFTLHWGIRRKLAGLSHHTLLIPKNFELGFQALYRRKSFPKPPIVYLNEVSSIDPTAAPLGCSNLFAVVTAPAKEPHLDWSKELESARSEVMRTLREFGISFSEADIDFERVQTPEYFEAAHGSYKGSLYGTDEAHRLFGLFPLSNQDDTYRNLLYAGGSVQPGAGLPMVVLSGKFAAQKIAALNRR